MPKRRFPAAQNVMKSCVTIANVYGIDLRHGSSCREEKSGVNPAPLASVMMMMMMVAPVMMVVAVTVALADIDSIFTDPDC